jgi:putative endonuclease
LRAEAARYVGVTAYLDARLESHKSRRGFAGRYRTWRLVYVEPHHRMADAIAREKQLKDWRRAKKVALVEHENPQWRDLSWGAVPASLGRGIAAGPLGADLRGVGIPRQARDDVFAVGVPGCWSGAHRAGAAWRRARGAAGAGGAGRRPAGRRDPSTGSGRRTGSTRILFIGER